MSPNRYEIGKNKFPAPKAKSSFPFHSTWVILRTPMRFAHKSTQTNAPRMRSKYLYDRAGGSELMRGTGGADPWPGAGGAELIPRLPTCPSRDFRASGCGFRRGR